MGDLWKRHKTKIFWFLGVSGLTCLGVHYIRRRWNKINQHIAEEYYWREQARTRFNETQQKALTMTCSLLATLNGELGKLLDVEQLTGRLRQLKNEKTIISNEDKNEKLILWDRIKIWSFARTLTALYAQILLYLLIKIKFNIIGRQAYLDSYMQTFAASKNTIQSIESQVEKDYLTFTWYFIHVGVRQLMTRIESASRRILQEHLVNQSYTIDQTIDLINAIRDEIEDFTRIGVYFNDRFLEEILIPHEKNEWVTFKAAGGLPSMMGNVESPGKLTRGRMTNSHLRLLLDETRDYLESSDFKNVFKRCMDINFEILHKAIEKEFLMSTKAHVQEEDSLLSPGTKTSKISQMTIISPNPKLTASSPSSKKIDVPAMISSPEIVNSLSETKKHLLPLAKISALVYRQIHVIFDPNQAIYLQAIHTIPEVDHLGTVLFAS